MDLYQAPDIRNGLPQNNIKEVAIDVLNNIKNEIEKLKQIFRTDETNLAIEFANANSKWGEINIAKSNINRDIGEFNNIITNYGRYKNPNYSRDILILLSRNVGIKDINFGEIDNLLQIVTDKIGNSNSLNYLVRLGDPNMFESRGGQQGGYYKKYLKYKAKYLALKNKQY
jgi:hypothetical protein